MKSEFEEGFQVSADPTIDVKQSLPGTVPVVPLRDIVIYPYMIYPILAGRETTIKAINTALEREKYIMLVTQRDSNIDDPSPEQLYKYGTLSRIIQVIKLPNNLIKVLIDGIAQAKVTEFNQKEFIEANINYIFPEIPQGAEIDALIRHSSKLFQEYVNTNRNVAQETMLQYDSIKEPDRKLFYIASTLLIPIDKKQKLLELSDLIKQYYELINILTSELEILKIEKEIENKISQSLQRNQRKFIVQEQIKILQEELSDDEELDPEFAKLKENILTSQMPEDVKAKAMEEFNKFRKTSPMSPEATVSRNYLDWLLSMPWGKNTKDNLDINHAKTILDEDHFALEKPKERILEYIAVLNKLKNIKVKKVKKNEHHRALIICFVGPPGVGKTSIARSIARALGRNFVRISLGGVRDEAEIRGHRRTYIGSMPGKIIQSIRKASSINPIILMDEIDKMGMDWRGDPASALLEALDPEQNYAFNDHYLDIDFDLSKVLFITTANVQYNIPLPLQDRMEIIEMHGYLEFEKLEIAKRHILPKLLVETGLTEDEVKIDDSAFKSIINLYTREAGVRNLERELASLLRKIAKEVVYAKLSSDGKKPKKNGKLVINSDNIEKYLGIPRYREKIADTEDKVGSVVGLAWTSHGGDILNIEVSVMQGKEKITLTGQLGDVMKESALAGLSYIRSNAHRFGIKPSFFNDKEIHIHIPEGSIPKDGPSAGLTMAVAILSAVVNKPVLSSVAMTGEITLRGHVLQIGGLNEKLIAAQRSGIKTVLIPKANEKDIKEIPDKIKSGMNIKLVEKFEDAIKYCFKGKIGLIK